jgi:AraC-like DNA-binding protein
MTLAGMKSDRVGNRNARERAWLLRRHLARDKKRTPGRSREMRRTVTNPAFMCSDSVPAAEPLPGRSQSWSARVRAALASAHRLGELSFDDLARHWGLSSRSLRRRLASENTSLSELLEEARLTRSRDLLAQRQYSLLQIATMLGYAEANSFQRAFKRWAGVTPGSYRRSNMSSVESPHAVG